MHKIRSLITPEEENKVVYVDRVIKSKFLKKANIA